MGGVKAAYYYHPVFIDVRIGKDINSEQGEQSLPHEFIHGWLNHKMNYVYINPKRRLTEKEKIFPQLLGTVIGDFVVNKYLQDESFSPLSDNYFSNA